MRHDAMDRGETYSNSWSSAHLSGRGLCTLNSITLTYCWAPPVSGWVCWSPSAVIYNDIHSQRERAACPDSNRSSREWEHTVFMEPAGGGNPAAGAGHFAHEMRHGYRVEEHERAGGRSHIDVVQLLKLIES